MKNEIEYLALIHTNIIQHPSGRLAIMNTYKMGNKMFYGTLKPLEG